MAPLLVVACAGGLAWSAPGSAATHLAGSTAAARSFPRLSLTITDRNRARLARTNRLHVRVRAGAAMTVTLGAIGRGRSVGVRRIVRFRRAGVKLVSLPLRRSVRLRLAARAGWSTGGGRRFPVG